MTQEISRRSALLGLSGAGLAAAGLATTATTAKAAKTAKPAALTPQQLAGQRVIFSYPGLTPPSSLLQQISAGQAAGVIFFGENISSESQIASVISQLNAANASSPVSAPLLLMTDQEGGEVNRLPGAPANSEKHIGSSGDPGGEAQTAGTGAGQNLAGVGMNADLAPVLGVYRQAGDFLDEYQRSYSMDQDVAALCGGNFIQAIQAQGVAATAKHFPGLGAATASQNTDSGPVTLNVSLSSLRSIDEVPYVTAISAGVKMVMVSWAVYPALDASNPAGLSATVIQQELRTRLGFTGVTITDAIEAGALGSFGTDPQRAVLAARAGMDLILASGRDASQGQGVVSALASAYSGGTLSQSGFTAAVNRVTALRTSLA